MHSLSTGRIFWLVYSCSMAARHWDSLKAIPRLTGVGTTVRSGQRAGRSAERRSRKVTGATERIGGNRRRENSKEGSRGKELNEKKGGTEDTGRTRSCDYRNARAGGRCQASLNKGWRPQVGIGSVAGSVKRKERLWRPSERKADKASGQTEVATEGSELNERGWDRKVSSPFTFWFLRPWYCSIPCQTLDWKLNSLWVRDKCFYSDALFENKRPMMVSYLDSRIWSNIFNISKYTIFNCENYRHFFEKFVICIKRIINVPHYKNRILRMRLSSLNIFYS